MSTYLDNNVKAGHFDTAPTPLTLTVLRGLILPPEVLLSGVTGAEPTFHHVAGASVEDVPRIAGTLGTNHDVFGHRLQI